MHDHSWLVWGWAPWPVQAERRSAAVCGRSNSGFAIAMIALVSLGLSFAAQAQSKTAPVATPDAKPAATRNEDAQLYRNPTFAFRYNIPYGWRTIQTLPCFEAILRQSAGRRGESLSRGIGFAEGSAGQ